MLWHVFRLALYHPKSQNYRVIKSSLLFAFRRLLQKNEETFARPCFGSVDGCFWLHECRRWAIRANSRDNMSGASRPASSIDCHTARFLDHDFLVNLAKYASGCHIIDNNERFSGSNHVLRAAQSSADHSILCHEKWE